MRTFLFLLFLLAGGAGVAWYMAGRAPGPTIEIEAPTTAIGQLGELIVNVDAPGGKLSQVDIALEQEGKTTSLVTAMGETIAQLPRQGENRVRITQPIGKKQMPDLTAGKARIVVTAVRPVLFGYRQASATASREFEVRLTPPQISVTSSFHYINQGGSEMVVYQVTPADVESGVRVGEFEYRGYPAEGAGIPKTAEGMHVAFFALLWDQDANTPIKVFARDKLGNENQVTFDYQVFPKKFRKSTIPVNDRFLSKVVPPILANSPELKVKDPNNLLDAYLEINRNLRRMNNETIAQLSDQSASQMLWSGPFKQGKNTAVEAGFADQRTYTYNGENVDQQVHLGFDLASLSNAPIEAANNGKVVFAGWLGIYGNCVILDHGMGLQSLYAHLSSINVKVGDMLKRGETMGRSGTTGLSGGDHLHFTMLLDGNAITPIDWWSKQWIEDRVMRKLRDAGAVATPGQSVGEKTAMAVGER